MVDERILVVDDEEDIRTSMASVLESAGYICRTVSSGPDALSLLEGNTTFELLLCDLLNTPIDGLELIEIVVEKFPDLGTILTTTDMGEALRAVRAGAYEALLKPFDREELLTTVRQALENRRLKLESRAYQTGLESLVQARTQQLQRAMVDLERSYDATLEVLGHALRLKHPDSENHSKRVTAFTIAIARDMQVPPEKIRLIARGAFLHDIGNIAVPTAILCKPTPLSSYEIAVMRQHCLRGYELVRAIPFLSEIAEIVYAHQERFDGSGYPCGLRGEKIPLGARIVSVADALDAITSDRPYRPAQSFEPAREEIQRWSGRQFDPDVVKTFLGMRLDTFEELREQIMAQITLAAP